MGLILQLYFCISVSEIKEYRMRYEDQKEALQEWKEIVKSSLT